MFCSICTLEHDNPGQHGGYPMIPTTKPYELVPDVKAEKLIHMCDAEGCGNVWQTIVTTNQGGRVMLCFTHYRITSRANL